MNFLSFFNNWQIRLAIIGIVLVSLFAWHKVLVHEAVTQATDKLKLEYAQQVFRQVEHAKEESITLRQEKEKNDAQYKKNIAAANDRYNKLSAWVSNLPKYSSRSDYSGNTGDTKDRPQDIIGELSRSDGIDLAEYSLKTETLRQGLLACYAQYDSVKEKLDKLRLDNTSQSLKTGLQEPENKN